MTARTKSLLNLGVLRNNFDDAGSLLDRSNIDPIKLQEYATNAANFATQYKLPDLTFALNSRGNPDVSIFDFTSRYHSRYAAVVRKTKKAKILGLLVGDSLINPFWPTGTGIGKGGFSEATEKLRNCMPLLRNDLLENPLKDFSVYLMHAGHSVNCALAKIPLGCSKSAKLFISYSINVIRLPLIKKLLTTQLIQKRDI